MMYCKNERSVRRLVKRLIQEGWKSLSERHKSGFKVSLIERIESPLDELEKIGLIEGIIVPKEKGKSEKHEV